MDPVLREDIAAGTLLVAKRCAGKRKESSATQEDSAQEDTAAIDKMAARKRPRQLIAKRIGSFKSSSSEDGQVASCVQHQGEQTTHQNRSMCSVSVAKMVVKNCRVRAGPPHKLAGWMCSCTFAVSIIRHCDEVSADIVTLCVP